jgi:hypothetical protein
MQEKRKWQSPQARDFQRPPGLAVSREAGVGCKWGKEGEMWTAKGMERL